MFFSSLGTSSLVNAQPEAAQSELADVRSRKLFDASLSAHRAGELQRALCLMQGAQAASPHGAFLFNIAQLKRDLGRCDEARASYHAYLELEADPSLRRAAEVALDALDACPAAAGSLDGRDASTETPECVAWMSAALAPPAQAQPSPPPLANATGASPPSEAAATHPHSGAPVAVRPTAADSSANALSITLSLVIAGAGVALGCVAAYEAGEMVAAERAVSEATAWDAQLADRERQGQHAETRLWVFGASSAALLTGALLVYLLAPPAGGSKSVARPGGRPLVLRF